MSGLNLLEGILRKMLNIHFAFFEIKGRQYLKKI